MKCSIVIAFSSRPPTFIVAWGKHDSNYINKIIIQSQILHKEILPIKFNGEHMQLTSISIYFDVKYYLAAYRSSLKYSKKTLLK